MDIKKLVESIKSFRPSRNALIAAGVLVVAAAGGAYYFLVYEPEQEREAAAAKQPVVAKPKPAAAPAAAKPVAASGVPAAASGVPAAAKPVAASGVPAAAKPGAASAVPAAEAEKMKPALAASAPAPAQAKAPEPAKPGLAAEKLEPKKQETATKTEQADKAGKETDASNVKEESQMVREPIPEAAPAPAEPAASVAAEVPVMKRGRITPKYNDIMTAVLRGDREAVKELLDLGWWVDKPGENGVTPLMAAVMNRDTPMVQLLLENGAEPTLQALNLARKNKDAATAALLEQRGAQ